MKELFMEHETKLVIYRGIIQYLLNKTNYTLKNIAAFSGCSMTQIHSIYSQNLLPKNFTSEIKLIQLFQIILELNSKTNYQYYNKKISNHQIVNYKNAVV